MRSLKPNWSKLIANRIQVFFQKLNWNRTDILKIHSAHHYSLLIALFTFARSVALALNSSVRYFCGFCPSLVQNSTAIYDLFWVFGGNSSDYFPVSFAANQTQSETVRHRRLCLRGTVDWRELARFTCWIGLSLSRIATYTHRPQGVNLY